MSKVFYQVGINTNTIALDITVGTEGVAYTSISIVKSDGNTTLVKESNANSGSIASFSLGTAGTIKGSSVVVKTQIDTTNVAPENREQVKNTLKIKYHFSGGFSGDENYNQDDNDTDVSPSGILIVVTKVIALK